MRPFIDFEWLDAWPSPDVLSQVTMAELEIRVGDSVVTSVLDHRAHAHRRRVRIPLYPLAEWVIRHWWHLWYEPDRHDSHRRDPDFEGRHDLAFAGDGFVLPRLRITPFGAQMRLQWFRWKPVHAPLEFLEEGHAEVPRTELEEALQGLVDAVLERLRDQGQSTDSLAKEWAAIHNLDRDEQEFCRAAALLGVDPFEVSDEFAESIVEIWDRMELTLREEAFASAGASSQGSLRSLGCWLDRSLAELEGVRSGEAWPELRRTLPGSYPATDDWPPWERGYALARLVRQRMEIETPRIEFEREGPWALRFAETKLRYERILGLVGARDPSCLIRPKSETSQRFLLARALGEYLSRTKEGPGMVTALATFRQAQSRAFAAELLAPRQFLCERLPPKARVVDTDTVDDLARELHVSSQVVRHQIENRLGRRVVDVG